MQLKQSLEYICAHWLHRVHSPIFIMIRCSVIQVQVYYTNIHTHIGYHRLYGGMTAILCVCVCLFTQCYRIFSKQAATVNAHHCAQATSTLKMQSSAKHYTSVNYCWKLFWSHGSILYTLTHPYIYILVWLHGLGLHTLIIIFCSLCFVMCVRFAFMLLLVPMQSLERCDFMQRKSTDDNVWVRSSMMLLLQ